MQIFEALQTQILKRASSYQKKKMTTFHLGWRLPGILMDFIQGLEEQEEAENDI